MAKSEAQRAHALLTLYLTLFEKRYKRKPIINRYRDKWGMMDVIDSVGAERARDLLEYYFKVEKPGHPLSFFFNNFDRMDEKYEQALEDAARRAAIMRETKERVEGVEH